MPAMKSPVEKLNPVAIGYRELRCPAGQLEVYATSDQRRTLRKNGKRKFERETEKATTLYRPQVTGSWVWLSADLLASCYSASVEYRHHVGKSCWVAVAKWWGVMLRSVTLRGAEQACRPNLKASGRAE